MNSEIINGIIATALISSVSIIGIISFKIGFKNLNKLSHLFVSFAIGALLGNAILHIIPEVYESYDSTITSLAILLGILIFYSLEQFLRWRHCHDDCEGHNKPIAVINIIGDSLHNFLDGILIATSFMVSTEMGIATSLAILLHEIPQEIGDFGVLVHAKWEMHKIIKINLISAGFAFLGLFIGFLFNNLYDGLSGFLLPLTAGGFLYLACSDLIPDLHSKNDITITKRIIHLLLIVVGITIFMFI